MSEGYSDDFDELSSQDDSPIVVSSARKNPPMTQLNSDNFSSYHSTPARTSLTTTTSATPIPRSPHGRDQSPTYPVRAVAEHLSARSPVANRARALSLGSYASVGQTYPTEDSADGPTHLPPIGGNSGGATAYTPSGGRNSISKHDVTAERMAANGTDIKHAMHVSKFTTVQRLDEDDAEANYERELSSEEDEAAGRRAKGNRVDDSVDSHVEAPEKTNKKAPSWRELGDSEDDTATVGEESVFDRRGASTRAASANEQSTAAGSAVAYPTEPRRTSADLRGIPLSLQGPASPPAVTDKTHSDNDGRGGRGGDTSRTTMSPSSSSTTSSSAEASALKSGAAVASGANPHSATATSRTSSSSASSAPSSSRSSSSSSKSSSSRHHHEGGKAVSDAAARPVGITSTYPTELEPASSAAPQRNSTSTSLRGRRQVNATAGAVSKYDRFQGSYGDEHDDDSEGEDAAPRSRAPPSAPAAAAGKARAGSVEDSSERDALVARCVELRRAIEEWNGRIAQQEKEAKLLRQRQQQQKKLAQARGGKAAESREKRIERLRSANAELASEVASYEGNEIMSVAFLVARAQKQLLAAKARLSEAQKVKRVLASRDKRAAHTIEEVHRRQPDASELEHRQVNEGLYSLASLERQRRELKNRIGKTEASRDLMHKQCEKLEEEVQTQRCADISPKEFEALQERYMQAQKAAERATTAIAVYTNAIKQGLNENGSTAPTTPRRRASRAMSEASGAEEASADLLDAYARQRQALETEKADLLLRIEQKEAVIAANTGGEVYTKARALPDAASGPTPRSKQKGKGRASIGQRAHTPQSRRPSHRPSAVDANARSPSSAQARLSGAPSRRVSAKPTGRSTAAVARSPQGVPARRRSSSGGPATGAARSPQSRKAPGKGGAAAAAAQKPSHNVAVPSTKPPELAPTVLAEERGEENVDGHEVAPSSDRAANGITAGHSPMLNTEDDSIGDVLRAIDEDNARLLRDLDKKKAEPAERVIDVRHHPFLADPDVGEEPVDDLFGPTSMTPPALAKKAEAALDAALDGGHISDVVDDVPGNVAPATDDNDDSGRETPPWLR